MTDREKLAALRQVFKSGRVPSAARGRLLAESLITYVGRYTNDGHYLLTPAGIAEAERLGADDPDTQRLKVWKNRVVEWVIAESPEEATNHLSGYLKDIGASPEEMDAEWRECPADKPLTMHCEDEDKKFTRLPAQWAALEGPGFLGSTEY